MSLVITGASGHLGRRTAELLLDTDGVAAGDVVLVTRSPGKLEDLAARGAVVRAGDFADESSLEAAFADATRVLILSTDAVGARVEGHRAAVAAAAAAGAQLIAYTSIPNPDRAANAAGVVPDHADTEEAIAATGVAYTFLRNALYAEFRIPEAQSAIASGVYAYNSGDGATAYVSREDCAAAGAAVLAGGDEHANRAYDITGPEALTGAELAELYASLSGRPVEGVAITDTAFVEGAVENGLLEPVAQLMASFGRAIRDDALNQVSDAVEQLTGRKPRSVRDVLISAGIGQG
jgi:NAD(P)H dehydrogenase (quinone)